MLAKNKFLEELDLSTNKLGRETVANMHLGLKYNNTIRIINLSHSTGNERIVRRNHKFEGVTIKFIINIAMGRTIA